MSSSKIKFGLNLFLTLCVVLSIITTAVKLTYADISNPHPIPPTNSVTGAMLKSGIIVDSKVSATASINIGKLGQSTDGATIPFSNGTNLSTSTNLQYFTASSTFTVLGNAYITGTTTLNNVPIKFPSTQCLNNQTFKNDGKGNLSCGGAAVHTFSKLTSTSSVATYTTPAGATQLKIRMVGAGGGGAGGNGTTFGTDGTATTFGTGLASTTANGGQKGQCGSTNACRALGGSGGTTNVGIEVARFAGASVGMHSDSGGAARVDNYGANSVFGGGGADQNGVAGQNAAYLSGSGGSAGMTSASSAQGAAAGEYVEYIINTPAATYLYKVGTGGTGGTDGTSPGGQGGDGVILIEESY